MDKQHSTSKLVNSVDATIEIETLNPQNKLPIARNGQIYNYLNHYLNFIVFYMGDKSVLRNYNMQIHSN